MYRNSNSRQREATKIIITLEKCWRRKQRIFRQASYNQHRIFIMCSQKQRHYSNPLVDLIFQFIYNQQFYMIPLSNGRSPRVDQFYATLRAIKSHQIDQDSFKKSQQDRSIQQIRSLGKQILDNQSVGRKRSSQKQMLIGLNRSTQILPKPINLYDKYNQKVNKKVVRQIVKIKQNKVKQQLNKTPQRLIKNKKYVQVPSKIQTKKPIYGLNYEKRINRQAQKLKKQVQQSKNIQNKIKQSQKFYDTCPRFSKTFKQSHIVELYKRAQQINERKQKNSLRIRTQQIQKEMQKVTFHPKTNSHKISNIEPNFQKRRFIGQIQKLSKQKNILEETVLSHTFSPRTNYYMQADSKISKIWKQQRNVAKKQSLESYEQKISRNNSLNSNEYKQMRSQQTTNSTMQINLKNMNQLSFIFQ